MILPETIQELKDLLQSPKKCVIVTHRNPDGDALGSSLGWKGFLEKKGHDVCFISPTYFTASLKWMKGTDSIWVFEDYKTKAKAIEKVQQAEVIFCLDFNALSRLEDLGEHIQKSAGLKVMIDHHQQPENFASIVFSSTAHGATAEMIYDIIEQLHETDLIDAVIAENLYTGLATDTGFFSFSNSTKNVHKVAGALIEKGASPEFVQDKINSVFREERLRFFGFALLEKLKVVNEGKVAYILISEKEARRFNLQLGENEGLVNYAFKIEGVQVSVLFSEEKDKVKISFRSKGTIDVNTFARNNFEGGGHRNAAGGKSSISLDETEKKFLNLLNEL